jgi:hypothetical protein
MSPTPRPTQQHNRLAYQRHPASWMGEFFAPPLGVGTDDKPGG